MKMIDVNKIHISWCPFFTEKRIQEIENIENKIGSNINPTIDKVFRFATTDLNNLQVCILSQDPYPNSKVPTGRAFEVGTLTSWTQKYAQHSLKNIVRLIYKAYNSELIDYEDIKKKITVGEFDILPPRELFDSLEQQGVLFLNTYLTCESGKANSHREIWQDFSNDLIKFISQTNPDIIWFLWGGEAQKNEKYISKGKIYKSNHPRLYDTDTPNAFLNSNCFEDTKELIDWRGVSSIEMLRRSLPTDIDAAIKELQDRIKKLPPKICYFNSVEDFVAPFTITCDEEMLMQLLLMEKDFLNIKSEECFSMEQVKEMLNRKETEEEKKARENKYLQQAEEGIIRKFIYK